MSVGFVMLAHASLGRASQVARHLASHGCPVFIHVDKRTADKEFDRLAELTRDVPLIRLLPRVACDWGTWSLVLASRSGAADLLNAHPDVEHVFLMSGACLPITRSIVRQPARKG